MLGPLSDFLAMFVDFAWGMPLVVLLLGGGFYLLALSRFQTIRGFFHAWKLILGKFHHADEASAEGQISHFRALTNALSGTIGLGNIAGVAVAISQGGPGAIFWMWVAALVGMNTKFFECSLSVMFRGKDYEGGIQGGPMYVIEKALPKGLRFLAYAFSIFGLIGTLAAFNANQVAVYLESTYSIPALGTGIFFACLIGFILFGGLLRLSNATSKIVPFMAIFYVLACLGILFVNLSELPRLFALIVDNAFSGRAAFGGAVGLTVAQVLQIGMKRAAFSNEAGMGTAPMAHGNAKTSEPIAEGLVAMVGPFLDTILICTMTALVILIGTTPAERAAADGVLMTTIAFTKAYPNLGQHLLGIAVVLFSFSTLLGMANYNRKCWDYLFKGRKFLRKETFIIIYCSTIIMGSVSAIDDVINLLDSGFALMAVPNMIATLWLARKVRDAQKTYFNKYLK